MFAFLDFYSRVIARRDARANRNDRRNGGGSVRTEGESEPASAASPADIIMDSIPELTASLLGSTLADQDMGPSISIPAASVPDLNLSWRSRALKRS